MPNYIENAKPEFQKILSHLEQELKNIRTGRANAAIVEDVKVEAYGSTMELKGLAAISVPDAKTIQIEPWDKGVVKEIEKALIAANLGMSPNVNGTVIRLVTPALTEETRKTTVKSVHQKGEQTHISIRNIREEIRASIAADEKAGSMGEDEKFRLQDQLEQVVKTANQKVDELVQAKEEEVMTI